MRMDIDDILTKLGCPGRYGVIVFIMCYISTYYVVFTDLFPSLYGATPSHNCRLPTGVNKNESIPRDDNGRYEQCEVFVNYTKSSGSTRQCPNGWEFELEGRESTISTEWSLVCDKGYLVSMSISLYYVGVVLGSALFGTLSDVVGRKPILIICIICAASLELLTYFINNFILFCVLRLLTGIAKQGIQIAVFVLSLEYFVTPIQRSVAVAILETPWSLGGLILALVGWLLGDWRLTQLFVAAPCVAGLLYIWFIPESLRWQISTKRYAPAIQTIKRMAKLNGTENPLTDPERLCNEVPDEDKEEQPALLDEERIPLGFSEKSSLLDILKFPRIRRRTFILLFIWFANSFLYYGLILSSFKLPGNRFVNMGISMAVELPGYVTLPFLLHRFKRRNFLVVCCILSTFFTVTAGFSSTYTTGALRDWLYPSLYHAAKIGTSVTWAVLSLISCELYPTSLRTSGYGLCLLSAKVGSIVAPQLLLLSGLSEWGVLVLPGVTTFLAAMLALCLPETRGLPLPETVAEAESNSSPLDRALERLHWSSAEPDVAQEEGTNDTITL